MEKCECCGFEEQTHVDGDTLQKLCVSCFNEIDTIYCSSCNTIRHMDNIEWNNSQPVCDNCGNNLKL